LQKLSFEYLALSAADKPLLDQEAHCAAIVVFCHVAGWMAACHPNRREWRNIGSYPRSSRFPPTSRRSGSSGWTDARCGSRGIGQGARTAEWWNSPQTTAVG
jgi:hypothetical protein